MKKGVANSPLQAQTAGAVLNATPGVGQDGAHQGAKHFDDVLALGFRQITWVLTHVEV